ncbi:MAG: SpoIIE family protein phosphatase [Desulfonatronovibrio sp.]
MFKTIRSKLITIMALILLLTAVVIIYFTHRDVGREVTRVEENNVENILDLAFVNIQEVYRDLISSRVEGIEATKERLKRESGVILSVLDLYLGEHDKFSGADEQELQERFTNWLWELDTGTTSFFIADSENNVVFDTEMSLAGHKLDRVKDIKGQPLSEAVNQPLASYDQFVVFSPEGSRRSNQEQRLGFLTYLPQWEWVLGAFIDISYIEEAEAARIDQLLQSLENQFSQVRIAETGSMFIFDQQGNLEAAPDRVRDIADPELDFPVLRASVEQEGVANVFVEGENTIAHTRFFRPLNWYLSALIPRAEIQAPARALVQSQSLIIAGIFLLGAIVALFFVRHISRPLGILAGEAESMAGRDLASDDTPSAPIIELTKKYHDEVGALAGSFLYMQDELRKNILQLVETTAAKERYKSELNMAREIQMSIVPKEFPPFPEIKEFELFALLEPAREVGGDLYDYFMLDQDHLCFTVGDVSDKGMPAALYMAITRTLIQSHSAKESSPARIMTRINNDLSKDNPKSMFVTLIIAIMNIRTGHIRYANAGHNLPVFVGRDQKCHYAPGISGPVAGAMDGIAYKELDIELRPGDGLLLYTDGITEAMNQSQELFSDDRLLRDVEQAGTVEAQELIKDIRNQVMEFVDGAPQSDDITMLMLRYKGG